MRESEQTAREGGGEAKENMKAENTIRDEKNDGKTSVTELRPNKTSTEYVTRRYEPPEEVTEQGAGVQEPLGAPAGGEGDGAETGGRVSTAFGP